MQRYGHSLGILWSGNLMTSKKPPWNPCESNCNVNMLYRAIFVALFLLPKNGTWSNYFQVVMPQNTQDSQMLNKSTLFGDVGNLPSFGSKKPPGVCVWTQPSLLVGETSGIGYWQVVRLKRMQAAIWHMIPPCSIVFLGFFLGGFPDPVGWPGPGS